MSAALDRPINAGPGRVLVGLYGLFALSAGARAGYQIATKFHVAPLAYVLSAVSAAIYLAATIALARGGPGGRRFAIARCTIELAGVLLSSSSSAASRRHRPLWPSSPALDLVLAADDGGNRCQPGCVRSHTEGLKEPSKVGGPVMRSEVARTQG